MASPRSERRPKVAIPPRTAPGTNVAQAAIVVDRRPSSPASPIVSTIEKPQGDQAPVRPINTAAAARLNSSALTGVSPHASTRDMRLVVLNAEDLAAAEAVALQRRVPVDPRVVMGAAVPQLAHRPAA